MIELHTYNTPNGRKISVALEEMGLPYSVHVVDITKGEQHQPAFLQISPNNRIPAIIDPDGPGGAPISVFESGAILLYLARKCERLLPTAPLARSLVEQWLMLQIASMGPMFGQCVHFLRNAPAGNDYARDRYSSEVKRIFNVLETRLEGSAFLGGAEYSIADVAAFPWIRTATTIFPWLVAAPLALGAYPALGRWFAAIAQRPAVQRGIEAGERFLPMDMDAFKSADTAAFDRFFGRGRFAHQQPV